MSSAHLEYLPTFGAELHRIEMNSYPILYTHLSTVHKIQYNDK